MSVGTNIKALRDMFGLDQVQLAEKLGVTRESVWRWEADKMAIRDRHIAKMVELFGIDPEDIKSEKYGLAGPMRGAGGDAASYALGAIPVRGSSAMVPVRVLGSTHAGERMDEHESDYEVEFPEGVVSRHPGCFALKVEGDCMNRRYPDGCMVLVDPTMEPRNGLAVVAEFEDGRSLMRVYMRGSSTLMLTADSFSEYEDIIVTPDDPPVRTVGVVVWYQAGEDVER